MVCYSRQWWRSKALSCSQTNGLASNAYSFTMTEINSVNTAYDYKVAVFASVEGLADASGLPRFVGDPTRKWTRAKPEHNLRKHAQSTGKSGGR